MADPRMEAGRSDSKTHALKHYQAYSLLGPRRVASSKEKRANGAFVGSE